MGPKNSKPDKGGKKVKLGDFQFDQCKLPNVSLAEDPMIFKDIDYNGHRQVSNYMDNVDVLEFQEEPQSIVSSISNVNDLSADSKNGKSTPNSARHTP